MADKRSPAPRRGLLVVGFLVVSLVAVGGAALATFAGGTIRGGTVDRSDRLLLAKAAFVDGKLRTAEELARQVLGERAGDPAAKLLLGKILLESGKLGAAREIFDAVHKEHPEQVDGLLGLAVIHERRGEFDLAIAVYRRAAEMRKNDARIWKALGLAQYRKDPMAALFSLRQSQKLQGGQEDVAKLMDEIGMSRAAMATTPGRRGDQRGAGDPFGDMAPRPGLPEGRLFDPSRPSPLVPDPLEAVRNPGGLRR